MEDKDTLHIDGNSSDELVLKNGDSVHVRLGNDSDYICIFKPDGTIEINPKYRVDEAAKEFWKLVSEQSHMHAEVIDSAHELDIYFARLSNIRECIDDTESFKKFWGVLTRLRNALKPFQI